MQKKRSLVTIILLGIGIMVGGALLIQLIPYGHNHTNPAVVQEPNWDSPQTRALAKRACFDCHSNETVWPWYANIAPVSWLTVRDVNEGREKLNFSEMNRQYEELDEVPEVILKGEMPMPIYLPLHPEANLTSAEKQALADGLRKTLGVTSDGD